MLLNFNEDVQAGTGSITIDAVGDNRVIDITDPQVVFAGFTVTITPTTPLLNGVTYTVTIPAGAIEDTNGNHPSDGVTFSFSTVDAATSVVVNTIVDENGAGATCSLREALQTVNTQVAFGGCELASSNIITFDPAVFVDPGTVQTITLNSSLGELVIDAMTPVEIQALPGSSGAGKGCQPYSCAAGCTDCCATIDGLIIAQG
ncbi:MAG: CSLREA domain-containing protein, partial [Synechococcaceae cyanobacterium SM2_3_2]|nr:CSLREA domain-containing protein [Synechococcaceae cyanobacterium SM2_3_2]